MSVVLLEFSGMLSTAVLGDPGVLIGLCNSLNLFWRDDDPVTFLNYADGEPSDTYYEKCTGKSFAVKYLPSIYR